MLLSTWTADCLSPWLDDLQLLKRLLYRNRQQHGPTHIFRQMRSVLSASHLFVDKAHWATLRQAQVEVAALSASTKLTVNHMQKLLAQRQLLYLYVTRSANVIHHIVKAARAISIGLQRRSFATLFAAWASFLGSFYSFFKNVLTHSLLPALTTTEEKLRMVSQVASHSKLRQLALQALTDESQQLSIKVQAILTPLINGGPQISKLSDTPTSDTASVDISSAATATPAVSPPTACLVTSDDGRDLKTFSAAVPTVTGGDVESCGQLPDQQSASLTKKRPIADDIDNIFDSNQTTTRRTKKRRAERL